MSSDGGNVEFDVSSFYDTEAFWVIWQVGHSPRGEKRIRRISQQYGSEARAEVDAERLRKSGAVTWVEKASPLAPHDVPAAAIEALSNIATAPSSVGAPALASA